MAIYVPLVHSFAQYANWLNFTVNILGSVLATYPIVGKMVTVLKFFTIFLMERDS